MSGSMLDIADPEAMLNAWFLWNEMGLEELGMGDVAEKLETVGRLINP